MIERVKYLIAFLVFIPALTFSQNGSIKGVIKDGTNGESLIGATVVIDGTTKGTITDFDGNFSLDNLQSGLYNINISFVSYITVVKKDIEVKNNQVTQLDVTLEPSTTTLEEVEVVSKANREAETVLVLDRKTANVAIESIGAQELSKKGVSDAAAAATKITGITKQEGSSSLNVRGLGDRYNTTTLNGLPLPSNNSKLKNIDLSLFSSDIISHISVEKTYSPWLYGDFGGANIDINTKKHTGKDFLAVNIGQGYNTSLLSTKHFYTFEGPGILGFQNEEFPDAQALDDNLNYDFKNSWDLIETNITPDIEAGLSGGKTIEIGSNSKFNTFFTLSFDNEKYKTNVIKRTINASNARYIDIEGPSYALNSQTTGMLNLNYSTYGHEIYLNTLFLNSGNQQIEEYTGFISEEAGETSYKRLLEFEQNMILVNQLLGEHKIGKKTNLDWGITYNYLTNKIPDRRQTTFQEYIEESDTGILSAEPTGTNYRYFHEYSDGEIAANISLKYGLGEEINANKFKGNIRFGYSGRIKNRDFESHQFLHDIYRQREVGEEISVQRNNIDSFLNNSNLISEEFFVNDVVNGGFTYQGKVFTNALFVTFDYNITSKCLVLLGSRLEYVYQFVDYYSNQGVGEEAFDKYNVLPSLAIKYSPTNKNNIRLSASKTYTLPQLREMPAIVFQDDVTEEFRGNPKIYPSSVYNLDLKFERFPSGSEIYSISGFYKYIIDPMNKFVTGSSSAQYSVANTGDWAQVYGIEAEIKKDIISVHKNGKGNKLTGEANATLMDTKQDLNSDKVYEETGKLRPVFNVTEDKIQGAAQIIGNLSLSHQLQWKNNQNDITSTIVYNYVSDRIYSLGYLSIGNRVDQPVNTLDFIVKIKLNNLSIGISTKNILNSKIYRIQNNQTRDWEILSYYKGTKLGLSLAYKF